MTEPTIAAAPATPSGSDLEHEIALPALPVDEKRPRRRSHSGRPLGRGARLFRYVGLRVLLIIPSLFFAATITFFLVNAVPSDPVRVILGDMASPEAVAQKQAELGLDQPLWQRYISYLVGLLHGDLGVSYKTGEPILEEMLGRLPATLVVTVPALLIAAALGVWLGVRQAATRRPGPVRGVVTALQSLPAFVLGVLGILVFVTTLHILPPPTGQLDISIARPPSITGAVLIDGIIAGDPAVIVNAAAHLVLPVLSLGLVLAVPFARITASAVSGNVGAEFSSFGTGNGIASRTVVGNARRSARTAIIVVTGLVTAELIGGAVIVERLFAWNGIGRWSLDAILLKDLPAIQGFVLLSTAGTIIVYLLSDIVGTLLDPRFR